MTLQGSLPALTAQLPSGLHPAQLSATLLDRIRNWALARAVAAVTDQAEKEGEDVKLQLSEDDFETGSTQSQAPAVQDQKDVLFDRDNIFIVEDTAVTARNISCFHQEALTLLQAVQPVVLCGEVERFTVAASARSPRVQDTCGCLLLLPAKQGPQAEQLKAKLAQLDENIAPLDNVAVESLVLYKEKVSYLLLNKMSNIKVNFF